METLLLVAVIGSTIWVYNDAKQLEQRLGHSVAPNSAIAWTLWSALLWIVGFPWYLVRRTDALRQLASGSRQSPAKPLNRYCTSCGAALPLRSRFCPSCGAQRESP